jgi:hypothetical protein
LTEDGRHHGWEPALIASVMVSWMSSIFGSLYGTPLSPEKDGEEKVKMF